MTRPWTRVPLLLIVVTLPAVTHVTAGPAAPNGEGAVPQNTIPPQNATPQTAPTNAPPHDVPPEDIEKELPPAPKPLPPGDPLPGSLESWLAAVFLGKQPGQPAQVYHLVMSQWLTNCYVLVGTHGDAIIIDPADELKELPNAQWDLTGQDTDRLLALLKDHHLQPRLVIGTHGHLDHVSGDAALKKAYPHCTFCLGVGDIDATGRPKDSHMFPEGLPVIDRPLHDGDRINCAGIRLTVLETPGHSPGSICLRCGNWLFSGDTLFYHTVGRTNFKDGSGNWDKELASIRTRLYPLPPATMVLPGHSLFTTIGEEKANNPWTNSNAQP